VELNRGLVDRLDGAGVRARVRENVERLERLGAEIAGFALDDEPALAAHLPSGVTPNAAGSLLSGMTSARSAKTPRDRLVGSRW
jgi:hypothetical protein